MNRLLELQRVAQEDTSSSGGGSAFSPTADSAAVAPSAAPDNRNRNNEGDDDDPFAVKRPSDYHRSQLSDDDNDGDGGGKDNGGSPAGGVAIPIGASSSQAADNKAASRREEEYVVQHDETLDKAIKLIEEITTHNRDIQAKTILLRNTTAENMKNFNPAAEGDEGAEAIDTIMEAVSHSSKQIKEKLDELAAETKALCEDEETMADNAATVKIQQNQHAHLTRTFMQNINDYNAAVSDNEKQLREQTVRRIKLKYTKSDGSTVSDDEAREMASQVLEYGRTDMLFQASKEVLNQVLETRQDILKIERSMRDLKSIMDDLSSLITEQGEIMDQVLTNVQTSVQYVQSGREKLKAARESAKTSSSRMKYAVACFCVLFLIILVSTLGATIPT